MRKSIPIAALTLLLPVAATCAALRIDGVTLTEPVVVQYTSDPLDAVVRRTDLGGASPLVQGTTPPDIVSVRLGRYQPCSAGAPLCDEVFDGSFEAGGQFLRLDLTLAGLVNPPGPTVNNFDPFAYGNNPLYGFVEVDVDENVRTGGDRDAPEFRYNANAARFGGLPSAPRFANRVSLDGADSDQNFATPPWIDRAGHDFALTLFAETDDLVSVTVVDGDANGTFDANETWELEGRFWRRAQAYNAVTLGGGYDPIVRLRFTHRDGVPLPPDLGDKTGGTTGDVSGFTTVSFVYPLTNAAYAWLQQASVEPIDDDPSNANSLAEAVQILINSALFHEQFPDAMSDPYEALLTAWSGRNPADVLHPQDWPVVVMVGSSRPFQAVGQGHLIWTDLVPNVVRGDVNGDGVVTHSDRLAVQAYIASEDGNPGNDDDDDPGNQSVQITNFGPRFSVYDINYDGIVDVVDRNGIAHRPGDYDLDRDVDLLDVAAAQRCVRADRSVVNDTRCRDAFDRDADGEVDWSSIEPVFTGPAPTPIFCDGENGDACGSLGAVCRFVTGDCGLSGMPGVCWSPGAACSASAPHVCGCDGVTYASECDALLAGVSIAWTGSCGGD